MNYASLFMISFTAMVRPHQEPAGNRIEMFNEFTILVLYGHCITQTDFVPSLYGRSVMGWSMIAVICFNVLINFGYIASLGVVKLYRRLKFWHIRSQKLREANRRVEKLHQT